MASVQYRILVVDDHADSAALLARLLKIEGHTVETAGSVTEAMGLCESEKFDLLISDIGLPDGSGFELMAEVQKRFGTRGIALSGRDDKEMAQHPSGFDAFLTKPVNLADVSAAISRIPCSSGN